MPRPEIELIKIERDGSRVSCQLSQLAQLESEGWRVIGKSYSEKGATELPEEERKGAAPPSMSADQKKADQAKAEHQAKEKAKLKALAKEKAEKEKAEAKAKVEADKAKADKAEVESKKNGKENGAGSSLEDV